MEDKSKVSVFVVVIIFVGVFVLNITGVANSKLLAFWPLYLLIIGLIVLALVLNTGGKKKSNPRVGEKDPTKSVFSKPNGFKNDNVQKPKKNKDRSYDSNDKEWHRCYNCNALIQNSEKYCPECGAVQKSTIKCPYCGHENPKGNLTCEKCHNILF